MGEPKTLENSCGSCVIPMLVAGMLVSWTICWAARFPAVMTPDSMDQWTQLSTGHYNDAHPVAHTLLLRAADSVWPNPAAGVVVQFVLMALAAGYALAVVRDLVPGQAMVIAAGAWFILHPVCGALQTTLWKDVPFSSAFLAFTACMVRILQSRNQPLALFDWSVLGLSGLCLCLWRHNGLAVTIAGLACLAAIQPQRHWRHLACLATILACLAGFKIVIVRVFHAPPPPLSASLAIPLQQTAAIIAADGVVTDAQREGISAILPWSFWKGAYSRTIVDPLKFHPQFDARVIGSAPGRYLTIWLGLCWQNPGLAFRAWLRQTAVLWDPVVDARDTYPVGIVENRFNLAPRPLSRFLASAVDRLFRAMELPGLAWISRPSLIHALLLTAAGICLAGGGPPALAPFVPWAAATFVLFFLIPSPDFRYFYPAFCSFPVLMAWTHACRRNRPATPSN